MLVLCAGDLHLGRRPSRFPQSAEPHNLSCAAVWADLVEYAIDQHVDLVALSGDLVDEKNKFYESLGPLERGLKRLAAAGIPAVAVAGNHDFDVLPELVRTLTDGCLTMLGVGGRWERHTITAKNGERLHVDGWSFATRHVPESPLASYTLPAAPDDAPILGLLHGDLDLASSSYAPLAMSDLQARGVAMWLLGHVHSAGLRTNAGQIPVLYPGSLQPMDPGEPGVHGAWIVEFAPGVPVAPRQIPLATVRYAAFDVDVSDATDLPQARLLVIDGIRAEVERLAADGGPLRHLSLRINLVGRSSLHAALEADGAKMATALELELESKIGKVRVHVERVEVATRAAHDLDALAKGSDAKATLARLVRQLETTSGDGTDLPELWRALNAIPSTLNAHRPYKLLPSIDADSGADALRAALADQATVLLDELMTQQERVA